MDKSSLRSAGLLILCIVIPLLAGVIGSLFTTPAITTWYARLQKPFFSPPNWVFGPVWTALYICGDLPVPDSAERGGEKSSPAGSRHFFCPACFQCPLVICLFWHAVAPKRTYHDSCAPCPHYHNNRPVLEDLKTCHRASRAVCMLGVPCDSIERNDPGPQLTKVPSARRKIEGFVHPGFCS